MNKQAQTILVTEPEEIAEEALQILKAQGFKLFSSEDLRKNENIIGLFIRTYTQVTANFLDSYPNLKFILRAGVGLDNLDLDACKTRNITIFNAPASNANAVAEYVIATMLMLLRSIPKQMEQLGHSKWRDKNYIGEELASKTIGLVGCQPQ